MRHRHRRALRDEKLGEQLADDGRAADHQRFEPGERRMDGPRERDAGLRRAGSERRQADRDAPDIEGMKPVNVLVGIDCRDHCVRIDLRR
jgi:hypothetical protein